MTLLLRLDGRGRHRRHHRDAVLARVYVVDAARRRLTGSPIEFRDLRRDELGLPRPLQLLEHLLLNPHILKVLSHIRNDIVDNVTERGRHDSVAHAGWL